MCWRFAVVVLVAFCARWGWRLAWWQFGPCSWLGDGSCGPCSAPPCEPNTWVYSPCTPCLYPKSATPGPPRSLPPASAGGQGGWNACIGRCTSTASHGATCGPPADRLSPRTIRNAPAWCGASPLGAARRRHRRGASSRSPSAARPYLDGVETVVFLAGQRYREFLRASLRSRGLSVSVPMEGLRIGEQLGWLTKMLHD